MFFKWSEEYDVPVAIVNEQHQELANLLNKLYHAFVKNTHADEMSGVLQQLIDYTDYHFGEEEKLLKRVGCKGNPKHFAIHKAFVAKIQGFQDELKDGKTTITFRLLQFLRNWLIEHIKGTDKKYLGCIVENKLEEKAAESSGCTTAKCPLSGTPQCPIT